MVAFNKQVKGSPVLAGDSSAEVFIGRSERLHCGRSSHTLVERANTREVGAKSAVRPAVSPPSAPCPSPACRRCPRTRLPRLEAAWGPSVYTAGRGKCRDPPPRPGVLLDRPPVMAVPVQPIAVVAQVAHLSAPPRDGLAHLKKMVGLKIPPGSRGGPVIAGNHRFPKRLPVPVHVTAKVPDLSRVPPDLPPILPVVPEVAATFLCVGRGRAQCHAREDARHYGHVRRPTREVCLFTFVVLVRWPGPDCLACRRTPEAWMAFTCQGRQTRRPDPSKGGLVAGQIVWNRWVLGLLDPPVPPSKRGPSALRVAAGVTDAEGPLSAAC